MDKNLIKSIGRWIGLILIAAPFIWDAWFPCTDGYWLMDILITIVGAFLIGVTTGLPAFYASEPFGIIGCIMIAIGWLSVVLYIGDVHKALTFSVLLLVFGGITPDLPRIISRFKKRKSFPHEAATVCEPSHVVTASTDLPLATNALLVTAPCPGTVLRLTVADGQVVSKGDEILVMDVMKMATPINAPCSGIVSLKVAAMDKVSTGDTMALILINSCTAATDCELPTKQDAKPEQLKEFIVAAVRAPSKGTVIRLTVTDGQIVNKGDEILVIDDLKDTEHPVYTPYAGAVTLKVDIADWVDKGKVVAVISSDGVKARTRKRVTTPKANDAKAKNVRNKSKTANKVIGKVPLLIDGNNVVRNNQRYGWRVLKTLLDWLSANDVDYFLYFDASIRYVMKEEMDEIGRAFIDAQLQDERRVTICPARDEADKFILSRANKEGNHIISDDGYRQWEAQYPWINAMNETDNRRVHKFSVEGDVLSVPDLDIREKIEES